MAKQTQQISIRITPPLESFLERWGKSQVPEAKPRAVARFGIEVFKAITEQLGPSDWLEITRRASSEGQDVGTFIGTTLKRLIEADHRTRK